MLCVVCVCAIKVAALTRVLGWQTPVCATGVILPCVYVCVCVCVCV